LMKRIILAISLVFLVSVGAAAADYNLYFGDLHSHTSFSDGTGLPEEAFDTAREAGMDFWTVSDHVEQIGQRQDLTGGAPPEQEWEHTRKIAGEKTEDGKFVAIAAYEWAMDPMQGHVNVINTDALTTFADAYPLKKLYRWLADHPSAMMGFNHPNEGSDVKRVFDHFKLVPGVARQTIYVATNIPLDFEFFYMALDNGWWVAPVAQQDNHDRSWGKHRSGNLTGVYAEELTYDSLMEAFAARRFYATNDRDLRVWFAGDGRPMGARIKGESAELEIDIVHDAGTPIDSVKLITNGGEVMKEWAPGGPELKATVDVQAGDQPRWYVVRAEAGDRFSMSAPIWLKK